METLIVKTKTKAQYEALKAVTTAMKMDVKTLEDVEDLQLLKLMQEGEDSGFLSEEESIKFLNTLKTNLK